MRYMAVLSSRVLKFGLSIFKPEKYDKNQKVLLLFKLFEFSITYTSSMPVSRACLAHRKKARTRLRALLFVFKICFMVALLIVFF